MIDMLAMMAQGRTAPHGVLYPDMFACCPEREGVEALVAALAAWEPDVRLFDVQAFATASTGSGVSHAEAARLLRQEYARSGSARVFFEAKLASGRSFQLAASLSSDRGMGSGSIGRLDMSPYGGPSIFPADVPLPKKRGGYSAEVAAAMACDTAMIDIRDILVRLCKPSPAITAGYCTAWGPPIHMGAAYHVDGDPRRDLALSWIAGYDQERIELAATWPLDVLRERVEAAPRGSSMFLEGELVMTREHVLAALTIPHKDILEALEVCVMPDPEWQAVAPRETHVIHELERAKERDAPIDWIPVTSEAHVRFIQQHAPASIERFDNGGIVLITHPYRTLWPLWADALRLLGIRP